MQLNALLNIFFENQQEAPSFKLKRKYISSNSNEKNC
ncbi:hypothetical protein NEOC65_000877 [Neochlamydia sp. AcF65]|nr:hypothetical protein [Neochlamydia sp. AcF65]MBS4171578.1 hypothetical protein [Neochlamydia sp. AcF95]